MKAWMYCKLVRGTEPAAADSQGVVRVWESHQFQWALKTELLVACPPLPHPPGALFPPSYFSLSGTVRSPSSRYASR